MQTLLVAGSWYWGLQGLKQLETTDSLRKKKRKKIKENVMTLYYFIR